ncbi:MAG: acyltransferase [Candidatus Sulfotelmatobacter sp.]
MTSVDRQSAEARPLLRRKMPELDSVRGVAVLMVLFYHGFATRQDPDAFTGLAKLFVRSLSLGWTGVNLFFALSGFLITGILLDSKDHPQYYRRFYLRRALRILPAYYALLVLLAWLGRFGMQGENISFAFLGLSAIYLANVTVFFGVPMQFPVLWSLAVEEHFYLIWPTAVRNMSRRAIGIVAVVIAVASTLARVIAWSMGRDFFAHYTWMVADGLALGSLLAVLMRGPLGTRKGLLWILLSVSAAGLAPVLVDFLIHRPLAGGSLHITAVNLLSMAAIAGSLLLGTSAWRGLVQHRILTFFGEISYGLYLIHMLVFNLFDNLQHQFFPRVPSFKGHFDVMTVRFLISGSIAILLALLSRRYFEQRFLRLKDRDLSSSADGVREAAAA